MIKYDFLLDPQQVTLSDIIAIKIFPIHGSAISPSKSVISPGYNPNLSLKTKYNPSSNKRLNPWAKLQIKITRRKLVSL